jgi:hypothetical protein
VLKAKGWIDTDERGNYLATPKSSAELERLTTESIKYLARMYEALAKAK